jgi:hypothetical protein
MNFTWKEEQINRHHMQQRQREAEQQRLADLSPAHHTTPLTWLRQRLLSWHLSSQPQQIAESQQYQENHALQPEA